MNGMTDKVNKSQASLCVLKQASLCVLVNGESKEARPTVALNLENMLQLTNV